MNIINKFLETEVVQEQDKIKADATGLGELNALFKNNVVHPSSMRILPKIKQYQIWTVKKNYLDYEGELQNCKHPMMVLLTCDCEDLDDDTQFVRGCPLSPFIEMAGADDQVCNDSSIIGFPFLIEVWNEQPMLVDILDKYVGDYYVEVKDLEANLDKELLHFREIEISNARYLNKSILAYTNEMERSKHFSFSAVISFVNVIKTKHMPIMNILKPRLIDLSIGEEYALAAKSGNIITDNDCIDFCSEELPFKIEIRKKVSGYIMTIIPKVEISLRDNNNEKIEGVSNSERIVFENLKKGLYSISCPQVNEPITIRLK